METSQFNHPLSFFSFSSSLPPSLPPSFPPSLSPSLPLSLPPSLSSSLPPSLSPTLSPTLSLSLPFSSHVSQLYLLLSFLSRPFVIQPIVDQIVSMLNYSLKQLVGQKRKDFNVCLTFLKPVLKTFVR